MIMGILSGLALLAVAAVLIVTGLPDKGGESPRHLRFRAAMMIYPPVILAFLVGGVVQLFLAIY
jgi:hypothetical protein